MKRYVEKSLRRGWNTIALLALLLLVVSCAGPVALYESNKIYYTRANIWYEHPAKVYSTNYHLGTLIPVGSKIEMLSYGSGKARFRILKTGIVITFTHIPKHSSLSANEFFQRYFSETDCSSELAALSALERKNVMKGTIDLGMSKKAVFMAYGNPPSHRTPNVKCDQWVYWRKRGDEQIVTFQNGRVLYIAK